MINLLASLPQEKRNGEVFSLIDKIVSDNKIDEWEKNLFDDKFVNPTLSEIKNLNWNAAKVINDKIYDINITFEVRDDKTPISYAELIFVPEGYDYFITKYGMGPEDYDKVFPPEKERVLILNSINGKFDELKKEFSVPIKDMIGGKEYRIIAIVKTLLIIHKFLKQRLLI